ncbi:MAG TPA: S8 family serine peptidase [bacterium]|nr:S8 family serine peptidase [bacterium]
MRLRNCLIVFVTVLLLHSYTTILVGKECGEPDVLPGQILVQYERGIACQQLQYLCTNLSQQGFRLTRHYPRSCVLRLEAPGNTDPRIAIANAKEVPGVRRSEPVYKCHACSVPNDEWFWLQWNLPTIGYGDAWDLFLKDADFAAPAVIAVLDTGVAYENYEDDNYEYERAPDFDNIVFVDGYDAVNDDYHPNDDNGHGTFVCGVIAQSTNNLTGVASIAFGCKIMPVKVLGEYQSGDTASLVEGIYFAVDNGADVINCSAGFSWYYSHSEILAEAVTYAATSGTVLIGSAGNADLPYVKFPAAYNEFLAVGATLPEENPGDLVLSVYSNYGVALDVVAPGGDSEDRDEDLYPEAILAESFDGGSPSGCWDLWWASGTSGAAAQVSGIAGVLMSLGLDRDETLAVIKGTSSKIVWDPEDVSGIIDPSSINGFDCETGFGLVDVNKALEFALDSIIPQFPEYETSVEITVKDGGGGTHYAEAQVTVSTITSGASEPASGATVYGYWEGSAVGNDSKITSSNGRCAFTSATTSTLNPEFGFVITNIVKGGELFFKNEEIPGTLQMHGDKMIVMPLRATGTTATVAFVPWFVNPSTPIY